MSLNTLTVDQILNTYLLDADKIKNWWRENIDVDEDDIRISIFKNYVRDMDKPPREKSEFLLQFLLIQNGKPVLHKTGGKRIKKRTIRRKSKRSIRRKSRKNY
jgi:hypothetical protein